MKKKLTYQNWSFGRQREFLKEWKEILIEEDDEKLQMILFEILDQSNLYRMPAYAEAAGGFLEHFKQIPSLRKRLLDGSDLSEVTFNAIMQGRPI